MAAVYFFLSVFNLSLFIFLFVTSVFIGVCLLFDSKKTGVALVLIGLGGFGLYSASILSGQLIIRQSLLNQTLHVRGEFHPPSLFISTRINGRPARARLYLNNINNLPAAAGEKFNLNLTGQFELPHRNPAFKKYLRSRGIAGIFNVKTVHDSSNISSRPEQTLTGRLRRHLNNFFAEQSEIYPRSAAYLQALISGDRGEMSRRLLSFFRQMGISHLFVISGLHVGFFCGLILIPLNFAGSKLKFGVLTVFLFLYLSFLNWPVSALRAGLMIWLYFLARALNRRTGFFSVFISTVFLLMLFNPHVILDAGFQLTAAAVTGIYFVSPYAQLLPAGKTTKLLRFFIYNLGAYFGVLAALIYHFGYIPRYGFIFSYIAGMLFPLFLILLAGQWLFLATNWSFFALRIENIYFQLEQFLESLLINIDPLIVTGSIGLPVIAVLILGLWFLIDRDQKFYLRLFGFFLVLTLLYFLMQPGHKPHLEVKNIRGNFIFHLHSANADYLFLPRRTRLQDYDWYLLEKYLREKGVYRLKVLGSEYTRGSSAYFEPELIIEQYWTYWRNEGEKSSGEISYCFQKNMLNSRRWELLFANPSFLETQYSPRILAAVVNQKAVILGEIDLLSQKHFNALQESDLELIILQENESYRLQ